MKDDLEALLQPVGLPDDLVEVALRDSPAPSPAAVRRIQARVEAKLDKDSEQSKRQMVSRPRRSLRWVAAAAFLLASIGLSFFLWPAGGFAQFQHRLRFLPGFGVMEPQERGLAAPEAVRVQKGSAWLEVRGLVVQGQTAHLNLFGVGLDLREAQVEVNGSPASKSSLHWTGSPVRAQAWVALPLNLSPSARMVTVTLKETQTWRMTVPLVPVEDLPTVAEFGPGTTVNGYTVSARARATEEGTDLQLLVFGSPDGTHIHSLYLGPRHVPEVQVPELGMSEVLEPLFGIPEGEVWHLQGSPLPQLVQAVTVNLPLLEVQESAEAVTVQVPVAKSGATGRSVRVGRWEFQITRVEREGDLVRLYFDMGPADQRYLLKPYMEVVGIFEGLGEFNEHNQLSWWEVAVPEGQEVLEIRFSDPYVGVQGPWVVQAPVQR